MIASTAVWTIASSRCSLSLVGDVSADELPIKNYDSLTVQDAVKAIKDLKSLQDVLGRYHDAVKYLAQAGKDAPKFTDEDLRILMAPAGPGQLGLGGPALQQPQHRRVGDRRTILLQDLVGFLDRRRTGGEAEVAGAGDAREIRPPGQQRSAHGLQPVRRHRRRSDQAE